MIILWKLDYLGIFFRLLNSSAHRKYYAITVDAYYAGDLGLNPQTLYFGCKNQLCVKLRERKYIRLCYFLNWRCPLHLL